MHVRKGDQVVVIAGKEKGKRGKVLRLLDRQGTASSSRASTWSSATPSRRSRTRRAASSRRKARSTSSNVALWCGKCDAPRARAKLDDDRRSKKRRVCVKCGTEFAQTA